MGRGDDGLRTKHMYKFSGINEDLNGFTFTNFV